MSLQLVSSSEQIRRAVSAEEWAARVDLAAGHRVLANSGVRDMTYNHFSLRVPGEPGHFLVKRTDWMFEEVSASSLLKYDLDGTPVAPNDGPALRGGALIIHAGLLRGRPDLNTVLHTHTPAITGVSTHTDGLLPINQHGMRFYGKMKYHEFNGFEFDPDMTQRLLRDLDGGQFMLLRNHGALVCGESVAEGVLMHHWLEMACQGQVASLAAGPGNYFIPEKAVCEYAHGQFQDAGNFLKGGKDWAACLRLAERLDPTFKE